MNTTPFALITVLFIGIVLGLFLFAAINHFSPPTIMQSNCAWCHKRPVLNTIKKYKTWHRTRPEDRMSLLKELEAVQCQ